ncbi:MAG: BON domain-containing protein [Isosphaeraceae bacterium]|nr:BON domain-containing protein [Isosphaeraceae bacterium]
MKNTAQELADSLERLIQSRTHGRVRDLRVVLEGQKVVIRGRVSSYYMKQLAQHGALDALGGQRLINEIQVRT